MDEIRCRSNPCGLIVIFRLTQKWRDILLTLYMKLHIYTRMSFQASDFFSMLAHPLRLRSLMLLADHGELCVCELTHVLCVSQPMISRHLALLKEANMVADRRQGVWIYYRLHPKLPKWSLAVLRETLAGHKKQADFVQDSKALRAMPNRPKACCE